MSGLREGPGWGMGWLNAVILAGLGVGVCRGLLGLPRVQPGLVEPVLENLAQSGVASPVTAVLLNFRGYDTLLEMAVLTLAALCVWTIPPGRDPLRALRVLPPVEPLRELTRTLFPVAMLVGGYLLWVGSHAPGGAFQAGAVFAAGLVLTMLSGLPLTERLPRAAERFLLVVGLGVFLLAGLVGPVLDRQFLEFSRENAGGCLLLIELAAAVSIALVLATLFAGGNLSRNTSDAGERP